ncbi:glycoside hydrolase superfamily [Aspergillus karnatakaensis]|uniref:glycoside hydrolase superfamily n=1 Tax=Aspergillus karnatakaensis TaxID=1810916 RepID=UPI003CCCDC85
MLLTSLLLTSIGVAAADESCWPLAPNSTGGPLKVLKDCPDSRRLSASRKGLELDFIIEQCSVLADPDILAAGYDLCSIDGGWYGQTTDDYGRVVANETLFDIPALSEYLHSKGLRLGLYQKPGVKCEASNKTIFGTNITISSILTEAVDKNRNCYFDYDNPNTQIWHNEVIKLWASWGVDMIKLDYMTPGSIVDAGMPSNLSASAIAYHRAIAKSGRKIQLDVSSNVCRSEPYWSIWTSTADSIRVDTDINSYGNRSIFVQMRQVQRTIEQYRQFVNQQLLEDKPVTLRGNLDNFFVGNPAAITGVTDNQRITLQSYWIGASSNLLIGSDMTNLDALGRYLITSKQSIEAADFSAEYPMQPRNQGSGGNQARQLQAWIAGPNKKGEAYVLLSNLGPNLGNAGFETVGSGNQTVSITLAELGLRARRYKAKDVWFVSVERVERKGSLSAILGEGESKFLRLAPF